jgi:hypothetical protein
MKRMNLFFASLLLCSSLIGAGCEKSSDFDDFDEDIPRMFVPQAVISSFEQKYPNTKASWENERGMLKAEFRKNRKDVDAWFESNGTWVRSVTDLTSRDLPDIVVSIVNSTYPEYHIDDADLIETPTEKYYIIEIEKRGFMDMEIKLKVSEEGKILS